MSSAEAKPAADGTAAAAKETEPEEKVVLRSSDGHEFEVRVAVARRSGTVGNVIDDGCADGGVPLPNVAAAALAPVLEYLNATHDIAAGADADGKRREFEGRFFAPMDRDALFDLILAANFLHAPDLLGAACQCVADRVKDMTVEDAREYFSVQNDFSPEEEREVREQNAWAFDQPQE